MVSIIVVNWNSGKLLEHCVVSLLEHAGSHEIIVVDNGSDDGSLRFTSSLEREITILRNLGNRGFAAGNNLGWRRSRGEPILFLNPDIVCLPHSIAFMEGILGSDSTAWAVGGKLIDPSGNHQAGFNVRSFPTLGSVAAEMLLLEEIWPKNPWTRRYRMVGWDHASVREIDQPAAACLMVKRSAMEALGGFDESFYPAWFEDVDFCRRIYQGGGRILFEPSARFVHKGGVALERLTPAAFLKTYHTNQIRYFAKHHGRAAARSVRGLVVTGMLLRSLLGWAKPAGRRPPAHAYWEAARHFAKSPRAAP